MKPLVSDEEIKNLYHNYNGDIWNLVRTSEPAFGVRDLYEADRAKATIEAINQHLLQ